MSEDILLMIRPRVGQFSFGGIIDCEVNRPGRQITDDRRTQATIKSPEALFSPDDLQGTEEALVGVNRWAGVKEATSLSLKFGLDDIQGTGDHTTHQTSPGARDDRPRLEEGEWDGMEDGRCAEGRFVWGI